MSRSFSVVNIWLEYTVIIKKTCTCFLQFIKQYQIELFLGRSSVQIQHYFPNSDFITLTLSCGFVPWQDV